MLCGDDLLYNVWRDVVEGYNSKRLTVPPDKMAAIGGLASKIQKDTAGEYLAGLWRSANVEASNVDGDLYIICSSCSTSHICILRGTMVLAWTNFPIILIGSPDHIICEVLAAVVEPADSKRGEYLLASYVCVPRGSS